MVDDVGDGRPYSADLFMLNLIESADRGHLDHWEAVESVRAWVHGDWPEALSYLTKDTTHDQ